MKKQPVYWVGVSILFAFPFPHVLIIWLCHCKSITLMGGFIKIIVLRTLGGLAPPGGGAAHLPPIGWCAKAHEVACY